MPNNQNDDQVPNISIAAVSLSIVPSHMYHLLPPEAFTSISKHWHNWKRHFCMASGLSRKLEQADCLGCITGLKAKDIFSAFIPSQEGARKYAPVLAALEQHFVVKKNLVYECSVFNCHL